MRPVGLRQWLAGLLAWSVTHSLGLAQSTFYPQLEPCPAACDGQPPTNWTVYSSLGRLQVCEEPVLLDFALHNPLDDLETPVKIRACTAGDATSKVNALTGTAPESGAANARVARRDSPNDQDCPSATATKVDTEVAWWAGSGHPSNDDLVLATNRVRDYLASIEDCETTIVVG
jgi:hypothetical protein